MNVAGILAIYDTDRPNDLKASQKERWLEEVERAIVEETIKTHELPEELAEVDFDTYFDDWGPDKELLVPDGHINVYIHYLEMKEGWFHEEPKRRNAGTEFYNNALLSFKQYYNRTHTPLAKPEAFLDHTRV